ncbi:glycoside hydrolase family 53 protein [Bacteroides sedimenti]|uniref:Arabinogalactan endo-beta-1,4-galactanase n=1 Tax=Bacteroides sedimenti TaxID=2136147 RepID=A0ABN6Z3X3_9BACE
MKKKQINYLLLSLFIILHLTACGGRGDEPIPQSSSFAKGADVSWITEMEAAGRKFYNQNGTEMEAMSLLKNLGMNAIRLRVWVNPSDGWCNKQDLMVKAKRAKNLNLRIMIDFHYSDSWADPGKQNKPKAWVNYNFDELKKAVAAHTTDVLNELKLNGITPEWVQVGNETGNGMLWEDGKASVNMKKYAELSNTGYNAVKSVFPDTKVIIHLQNGYDNVLFRWLFDGLRSNGGKWDVIGMSLYPSATDWRIKNSECLDNMNDMVKRFGSEVMMCEVGMSWDIPDTCYAFLKDIIAKTKSVSNGKGIGVFYWEPECSSDWNGYSLGAFDNNGRPTAALNAFR